MSDEYFGSVRMTDGTRRQLTSEEAKRLIEGAEASRKARAEKLPDEQSAINAMFEAFDRLRELGWNDASYCPKDGSMFLVIEPGSTGIFECSYDGEWPNGSYWLRDAGDLWPSRPILFKLYPADEVRRKERMAETIARYSSETN